MSRLPDHRRGKGGLAGRDADRVRLREERRPQPARRVQVFPTDPRGVAVQMPGRLSAVALAAEAVASEPATGEMAPIITVPSMAPTPTSVRGKGKGRRAHG